MTDDLPFIGRTGPLSQRVADELAERILAGSWDEGRRLPSEPELSAQFGVSRSVVRDAIRALQARGLVDVRQGFGTVVRKPSDEPYAEALFELLLRTDLTIGDLVAAREPLDIVVAELAAERRTEDDIASLGAHLDEMLAAAETEDWERVEQAHLGFHLGLIEATHLPALRLILKPMQRIVIATGLPATVEPSGWDVEVHTQVLETIAAGSAADARAAMYEHYRFARDPAYAELHAIPFRDFPAARDRLTGRRSQARSPIGT